MGKILSYSNCGGNRRSCPVAIIDSDWQSSRIVGLIPVGSYFLNGCLKPVGILKLVVGLEGVLVVGAWDCEDIVGWSCKDVHCIRI